MTNNDTISGRRHEPIRAGCAIRGPHDAASLVVGREIVVERRSFRIFVEDDRQGQ